MQTQPPATTAPSSLPEIALSELPEATKDFLIAHSSAGKSVPEVMIDILDAAAARAGFEPNKAA